MPTTVTIAVHEHWLWICHSSSPNFRCYIVQI